MGIGDETFNWKIFGKWRIDSKHEYFLNNNSDKVTLVYFNDMIETKPQKLSEMKPIIKNDVIIMAPNYFNRGNQFINYP